MWIARVSLATDSPCHRSSTILTKQQQAKAILLPYIIKTQILQVQVPNHRSPTYEISGGMLQNSLCPSFILLDSMSWANILKEFLRRANNKIESTITTLRLIMRVQGNIASSRVSSLQIRNLVSVRFYRTHRRERLKLMKRWDMNQ